MLNAAQFEGTGGWVLKPKGYLPVEGEQLHPNRVKLDVKVKLLAAQGLGRADDIPSVYVKCELHVESKAEAEDGQIPRGGKNKGGEYKWRSTTRHNRNPDFGGDCKSCVLYARLREIRTGTDTTCRRCGVFWSAASGPRIELLAVSQSHARTLHTGENAPPVSSMRLARRLPTASFGTKPTECCNMSTASWLASRAQAYSRALVHWEMIGIMQWHGDTTKTLRTPWDLSTIV